MRHEAYVADAEEERSRMDHTIRKLEDEKRTIQVENAKSIEENRVLLDQLEDMNRSVADSEVDLQTLKARLLSTQQELQRVSTMAARTINLESQLETMETEHGHLHQTVAAAQGEERRRRCGGERRNGR